MTRKKGWPGDSSPQLSPNVALLPSWLDADGSHGKMSVLLMKPADEGVSLPSNPFTLAKSIQTTAGTISEAYRNKDQNIVLKVRGEDKVQKLQRMTQLIDGTKIVVAEHPRLNRSKVVVTCNSVKDLNDDELKAEPSLQAQGVVDVRRFRREGSAMILTIHGTVAPEAIFFGYDRCKTKPYVQAPLQCYRCFQFGHPKSRCTAEEVCRNCSMPHEIVKNNEGKTICDKPARCRHCSGPHSPTSRICNIYKQEEEIEKIRSTGKSPWEARRIFEERQRQTNISYAAVSGSSVQTRITSTQQHDNEHNALKRELASTQMALKRVLEEIEMLKAGSSQRSEENYVGKSTQSTSKQPERTTTPTKPVNESSEVEIDINSNDGGQRRNTESNSTSAMNKRRLSESSSRSTLIENNPDTLKTTNPKHSNTSNSRNPPSKNFLCSGKLISTKKTIKKSKQ